jgi:hypothetical protein
MMAKGWAEVVVGWLFRAAELRAGGILGGWWKWVVVGGGADLRG